jgi:predicted amidohydrolase YtcJ
MKVFLSIVAMAVIIFFSSSCSKGGKDMADLILINGTIHTLDPARPRAEAVAVRDGRILKVGTTAEVRGLAGKETRTIDLTGGFILPGFIDSHTHFLNGGFSLSSIQLRDVRTREEFAAKVAAKVKDLDKGEWIQNGDWDHELFTPVELPRREWIDFVSPDNPVCVKKYDGRTAPSVRRHLG